MSGGNDQPQIGQREICLFSAGPADRQTGRQTNPGAGDRPWGVRDRLSMQAPNAPEPRRGQSRSLLNDLIGYLKWYVLVGTLVYWLSEGVWHYEEGEMIDEMIDDRDSPDSTTR